MSNITRKLMITIASDADREIIYRKRHKVFAEELGQHSVNECGQLKDNLDKDNLYIVAKKGNEVFGFISITLPSSPHFSVDKYFERSAIPYTFNDELYEIRLLTVDKSHRRSYLSLLLMYAAYRWIESRGGKYIVAICKADILDMYCKAGLQPLGPTTKSGQITYTLATATVENLNRIAGEKADVFKALKAKIDWRLYCSYNNTFNCFHGGAFYNAIGEDLQHIERAQHIINADVLDAWFPPSPKVIDALQANLPWLLKTSPPTHADGLIDSIAKGRNVHKSCILPGAGSSNLIFLGLQHFLNSTSKVLVLDPCYGEYLHVLENVIGCNVTKFRLFREEGFVPNMDALLEESKKGYDMIVVVNPNSPTGVYVPESSMIHYLKQIPQHTLIWIDETYIDFVDPLYSLESFAAASHNIIICKSMSKAYALSGARVAYLCASPAITKLLQQFTPPWSISLPAQLAAITALEDPNYYKLKYEQTHVLRQDLQQSLTHLGIKEIIEGSANFLLFYIPEHLEVKEFIQECRSHNLYLRDVSNMGKALGEGAVRIAVKNAETNDMMMGIMERIISVKKTSSEFLVVF